RTAPLPPRMAAWTCEGAYVVAPASDFHYRAFISYSHADAAWGKWLHKALETWRAPSRRASKQSTPNPIVDADRKLTHF
ncbi:hypothetical protein, partial [Dyella sp.]|uniref:hypothetical protein n=1 Tax=Dyella sp. TaxID=1869338 RepID=UPI002D7808CA